MDYFSGSLKINLAANFLENKMILPNLTHLSGSIYD